MPYQANQKKEFVTLTPEKIFQLMEVEKIDRLNKLQDKEKAKKMM